MNLNDMTLELSIVFIALGVLVLVLAFSLGFRNKKKKIEAPAQVSKEAVPLEIKPVEEVARTSLKEVLRNTRKQWASFFQGKQEGSEWEALEETLLLSDVGMKTTQKIVGRLKEKKEAGAGNGFFKTELIQILKESSKESPATLPKPWVISVVGVNGVGKTTTIGKLAHRFVSQGKTVLVGAADTFRAAAQEQLQVWAERSGAQYVSGNPGSDPGAIAFDAVNAARARGLDVVILDTAGRLHTKTNLMEELKKINRVIKKIIPEAPHEVWIVIDGTLGQNSIKQVLEFGNAIELTGAIVTKLDGTARGGAIFAIGSEFNIPVKYLGLGEKIEDLVEFDPARYVDALLAP